MIDFDRFSDAILLDEYKFEYKTRLLTKSNNYLTCL